MSVTVRVPKGHAPEISVTQSGKTRSFAVGTDDTVQCDSQEDANYLVRLINGSSVVETPAPSTGGAAATQSKENA